MRGGLITGDGNGPRQRVVAIACPELWGVTAASIARLCREP